MPEVSRYLQNVGIFLSVDEGAEISVREGKREPIALLVSFIFELNAWPQFWMVRWTKSMVFVLVSGGLVIVIVFREVNNLFQCQYAVPMIFRKRGALLKPCSVDKLDDLSPET